MIEGYGLTEASPVTHANVPGHFRPGSIGLPMPDTRVRIADLDDPTIDVPAGQPGEMLLSGPQIMTGYFANPEQTAKVLVKDAAGVIWLRTGDVCRMDADGFFYVLDRKKDMIIRSGLKVYPIKVERVLRMHKNVVDVAVVGRVDPHHNEKVVAIITPTPSGDREALLVEELRHLCREHLAAYEVPQSFEFMDQLPRSALGKLLKRELREGPAVDVEATLLPDPAGAVPRSNQPVREFLEIDDLAELDDPLAGQSGAIVPSEPTEEKTVSPGATEPLKQPHLPRNSAESCRNVNRLESEYRRLDSHVDYKPAPAIPVKNGNGNGNGSSNRHDG